jgi:site-specific recombinase XerD
MFWMRHWLGHRRIQNMTIYTHLSSATLEAEARDAFMKLPRF